MVISHEHQGTSPGQAAHHLALQLYEHASSTAIVVAASADAMKIAASLANLLRLPLEIIPSRVIRHPGNPSRLIGSVTIDDFNIDDDVHDIPRDYVSHQLLLTQEAVREDYRSYYSNVSQAAFRNKTIILVDEVIISAHPVITCLKSIKRQQPHQTIVAALYMPPEAARRISGIADQLTFFEVLNESVSANKGRNHREQAVRRLNKFRYEHAM